MYIIGITGGIGSGKTTVTDYFAKKNITVVDADIIARKIVEPNTPSLEKITQHFGNGIIDSTGILNRKKLGDIVFSSKKEKQWLENTLHPIIFQQVQAKISQSTSIYTLYSAPLLIEKLNKTPLTFNKILVIDISEKLQLQRTKKRDFRTKNQIQHIIEQQASRALRLQHADDVIDNSGDLTNTYQQCEKLHQQYCLLASKLS